MWNWYNTRQCGITLAARPGSSNHEGGSAIDTSYYDYWMKALTSNGWKHSYPSSDPVHFDYSGVSDIRSQGLKAFQRMYNRNTGKKIGEDGIYGPASEAAFKSAPCGGWKAAGCYACPVGCNSCTHAHQCHSCEEGFDLMDGVCVERHTQFIY